MRKIILLLLAVTFTLSGFCQINNIKLLIGQTEKEVTAYFDSLNRLKSNPYYKIKKDVNNFGDLVLKTGFSVVDESYYKCLSLWAVFQRMDGVEICSKQFFWGSVEFAQPHLTFIKDNFKFVSDGKWETPYTPFPNAKIVATFERKDGDYPSYSITYELENAK